MNYNKEEDRQVCRALARCGVRVNGVYDLVNTSSDYSHALPALLEWLPKVASDRVKEGIVRALTVKGAGREVSEALIRELDAHKRVAGRDSLKWAIGNALSVVASDDVLQEMIRMSLDREYGSARQMIVAALGKLGKHEKDQVFPVLLQLLDDEDVMGHAIAGLKYLGDVRALRPLQRFAKHPSKWIAKEASRAASKLAGAGRRKRLAVRGLGD